MAKLEQRRAGLDAVKCPRCDTTKYRNPNMKLLINECGHSLCDNCVEVEFVKGSNNCYQCGRNLRKNNFRLQIFEDCSVEKDVDIRRRVLRDLNRREEEFESLREYNDYLEFVETAIFNLTNGVNTESTKRQIDDYRKKFKDQIAKNKLSKGKNEQYLDEIIQQEKATSTWLHNQAKQEAEDKKKSERVEKEKLIEELTWSAEGEAEAIVQMHELEAAEKRRMQKEEEEAEEGWRAGGWGKATLFSTGDTVITERFVDAEAGTPFVYTTPEVTTLGPTLLGPTWINEAAAGVTPMPTRADLGGGFVASLAASRAINDAFCGLFLFSAFATSSMEPKKKKRKEEAHQQQEQQHQQQQLPSTHQTIPTNVSQQNLSTVQQQTRASHSQPNQPHPSLPHHLRPHPNHLDMSAMETSMMGGDVSLMDVSVATNPRMSLS